MGYCLTKTKQSQGFSVAKHHCFVENNSQLNLFVWDPTEPVATRPLFMLSNPGSYKFFYTFDGNKNVSELVHFESRNGIAAHYDYAPFGAVTRAVNTSAISARNFHLENPFRFSSEYHDDTLGLVYYNYRHYNPIDGRWCGRDLIGEASAQMLYLFLTNSPLYKIDTLGLWDNPQCIVDAFNGPSPEDAHRAYVESLLPPKLQYTVNLPAIDFSAMIGYEGSQKIPIGLAWSVKISISSTYTKGCCFKNGVRHSYSELSGTFGVSVLTEYSIPTVTLEPIYESTAKILDECPTSGDSYTGSIKFFGVLGILEAELAYEYDFTTKFGEWKSNMELSFTEFNIQMGGGGEIRYTIVRVE